MSTNFDEHTKASILRAIGEQERLRGLSNEQLVRECLQSADYNDVEYHVEEMMSRLWPEWDKQAS